MLLVDPRLDSPALDLYRDLLTLCAKPERAGDPWTFAVAAEASFALGDDDAAMANFPDARRLADAPTILMSPADQLALFAKAGYRRRAASSDHSP